MKVIYNEDYKKLFERAAKELNEANVPPHTSGEGDKVVINSLATYYDYLDELVRSCSPEFIRSLPDNEGYFVIDTNKRSITLPESLVPEKDGSVDWVIGVKDDHQAEILWFCVDRFYDDIDLAICFPNLDQINADTNGAGQTYIQWKNDEIQGLDEVCYVQITEDIDDEEDLAMGLESNKIYFGWVLQGDSIGAKTRPLDVSGDLTFSVRFQYHQGVKENGRPDLNSTVLFSFNTLPVTCTVYPNLTEQMKQVDGVEDLKIEDISSQSIMRPRFSGIYDNTKGPKPFISLDLKNFADLDADNEAVLEVDATASGDLKYEWYHDGELIQGENTDTYTATEVGSYKVHIGNEYTAGSIRWIESNTCEVPKPSSLDYTRNLPGYGFVNGDDNDLKTLEVEVEKLADTWGRQTGNISYTWYREPLGIDEHQETLENGSSSETIDHNESTYTPEPDKPGIYYVEARNSYNNYTTGPIKSDSAVMKARAEIPSEVSLTYDEVNNIITAHATIKFQNDLYYKWTNETTNFSTSWLKGENQYHPTTNGKYYCRVAQVIYMGTTIQDGSLEQYKPSVDRINVTRFAE